MRPSSVSVASADELATFRAEARAWLTTKLEGDYAAVRGRGEPGGHRLGVLVAGLTQVGVEVDEAGCDDAAGPSRRRSSS